MQIWVKFYNNTIYGCLIVYPGHDYNGKSSSTIGEEKKSNPRLQVKSQRQYVDMMSNLKLSNPKKMDVSITRNLKLGKNK